MLIARFHAVFNHLAEGDLAFYGALSKSVGDIPANVVVGDLFVATWANQVVWYEVIAPPEHGRVFVRLYSRIFQGGDYDHVSLDLLTASVTRDLFERARAHGFRTVRRSN